MNCKMCRAILPLYIIGELSPDEEETVRAHLQVCPHCAAEFTKQESLLGKLKDNQPEVPVPENYYSRLITSIHSKTDKRKARLPRFVAPAFSLLVVLLITAVFIFSPFRKRENPLTEDLNFYTFDLSPTFFEEDSLPPAISDTDFEELEKGAIFFLLTSGDFPQNMDDWVDLISEDQYNDILASLEKIQ